jgi:hypothetical protein
MSTTARDTATDLLRRCREPSAAATVASPSHGDFCLFDEGGRQLGAIRAVLSKPVFGQNAPTLFLTPRRER